MSKLPILPSHEELDSGVVGPGRFPRFLHRKLPSGNTLWKTHEVLEGQRLATVCEEASCPNLPECYARKTATFLAAGKQCTRNCGFCDISFSKAPAPLEADEPERLAKSVQLLGLKHVVITMVARDDLPDGGAGHIVQIVQKVREQVPSVTIELLTSDFGGNEAAYAQIAEVGPEIFNHNVETVRRLTPRVRNKATYERTLHLLRFMRAHLKKGFIKSGLMVGLGESSSEVEETLRDLHAAGCDIVTIGHYLQPSRHKLLVKSFVTPEQFAAYAEYGRSIGIAEMYCGPFVRSSYNADRLFEKIHERQP